MPSQLARQIAPWTRPAQQCQATVCTCIGGRCKGRALSMIGPSALSAPLRSHVRSARWLPFHVLAHMHMTQLNCGFYRSLSEDLPVFRGHCHIERPVQTGKCHGPGTLYKPQTMRTQCTRPPKPTEFARAVLAHMSALEVEARSRHLVLLNEQARPGSRRRPSLAVPFVEEPHKDAVPSADGAYSLLQPRRRAEARCAAGAAAPAAASARAGCPGDEGRRLAERRHRARAAVPRGRHPRHAPGGVRMRCPTMHRRLVQ